MDQILPHGGMDNIKQKELKKMRKKIHKVRTRMAAVRMARMFNMSVEETPASRYVAPRGYANGCAATMMGVLKTSKSPQRRSKPVRKFLRKNKNIKIMHSPKDSLYLNAVEECWR